MFSYWTDIFFYSKFSIGFFEDFFGYLESVNRVKSLFDFGEVLSYFEEGESFWLFELWERTNFYKSCFGVFSSLLALF